MPLSRWSSMIALAVVAAAVGASSWAPAASVMTAAETPAAAVDAVLDAVMAHDWDALAPLVCADHRDEVTATLDPRRALAGDGVDAGPLLASLTVTIEGRGVTPLATSGDRATVEVAGVLHLLPDDAAARAWVRDRLLASGQPADDATVDRFLGWFTASLASGTDLAGTVEVIREDGAWLLCDTLGGGQGAASTDAPLGSLCDVATLDELAAATGLALVRATATATGCQWDTDPAAGPATIRVIRGVGDLATIQDLWNGGRAETVGGRPAWATPYGTWVDLGGEVLAILPWLDGTVGVAGGDPVTVALAVGALVVPRLG